MMEWIEANLPILAILSVVVYALASVAEILWIRRKLRLQREAWVQNFMSLAKSLGGPRDED